MSFLVSIISDREEKSEKNFHFISAAESNITRGEKVLYLLGNLLLAASMKKCIKASSP